MSRDNSTRRLCALIVIALLASGTPSGTFSAIAEDSADISNKDALSEVVKLYEKMSNSEVEIPEELAATGLDRDFLKSVVLGFVNLSDADKISEANTIRKQDMINILYKTIISQDANYAITADEADAILNDCYDNAYIDDENRIAYAFMLKEGIASKTMDTEPNKSLTWDGCMILTDLVYDFFTHGATLTVNNGDVTIGANISTVYEKLGKPNRIDKTEYGFDWYVWDKDYNNFVMIGVQADRICAFYSNSAGFSYKGVKSGSDFAQALQYNDDSNLKFYTDRDGKVDAVLYNPRSRGEDATKEAVSAKSEEFIDIMNAYRVKNGKTIYVRDDTLNDTASSLLSDYMDGKTVDEKASIYRSYSVFNMFNEYLNDTSVFLDNSNKSDTAVGISAAVDDKNRVLTCLIDDKNIKPIKTEVTTVTPVETKLAEVKPVAEVKAPEMEKPSADTVYNEGDDIVIKLKERAATEYHIEIFDVEKDDYLVNEYIKTESTEMTFPSRLFQNGSDYRVKISSVKDDGTEVSSQESLISYGSAFDSGIKIFTPIADGITDDDYLAVSWKSDDYHDFCLDLYDEGGKLVTSKVIEGEKEAVIRGVDPGDYCIYITALRRGTEVEKSQAHVNLTVLKADPVITEKILEKDEKYYFVYEDKALGVINLYDEEIVDVNGVKKKKIIKKQVKATKAYKELDAKRMKPAYTTGDPTITIYNAAASPEGQAIITEAAKYLGTPYVWGGTTPAGFDCSGFVQYVMNTQGISVPRVSEDQYNVGTPVSKSDLQPGDLVFFEADGDVHHVGIYVGNGMMIHSPHTGDVIKYQSINTPYYEAEYAGARRLYKASGSNTN